MKNIFFNTVISLSLLFTAIICHAVDKIQYKQTAFGISEKEFLKKFKSDNFKCESRRDGKSTFCESTIASYSNQKPTRTWAIFYQNLLYSISIQFEFENKRDAEFKKKEILDSLKDKFGKPLRFKNTADKVNGINLKTDEYIWANADDASLNFMATDADGFTLAKIDMKSLIILERVMNEDKKSKLSDM